VKREPPTQRSPREPSPPGDDVAIRLRDVEFRYGEKIVLSDCSLDCKAGHVTCVIGMSGAGKSTILRVANGLRRPTAGWVWVNGREISHLPERELIEMRKRMGFAFQYNALFDSMTVGENVAFPLYELTDLSEEQIRERVKGALDSVGLEGVEDRLPSELSGGMQKRVGFARAIVNEPEIILFDEPTTGQDPIMLHVITSTIKRIQERLKATSVVVSHDLESVFAIADEIALLFEGTIIENGPVQKVRQSPNPIVQQFLQGSDIGPIPV
jgi:phospholipid/cholesterol/gamma-HCH transport system ATP-binding protein